MSLLACVQPLQPVSAQTRRLLLEVGDNAAPRSETWIPEETHARLCSFKNWTSKSVVAGNRSFGACGQSRFKPAAAEQGGRSRSLTLREPIKTQAEACSAHGELNDGLSSTPSSSGSPCLLFEQNEWMGEGEGGQTCQASRKS